ncbi:P-loop NTPase, partial [Kocuria kalidii]|uniref:P-loop NTPase n=1 Tax=Kocuria kalidii TaxID=3376283 RepID=UPI00378CA672
MLTDPTAVGSILLTGHGGIGKTRALFQVAELAISRDWEVLHMRGSNAAGVMDYLMERSEINSKPILLVVDYLNRYHDTFDPELLQDIVAAARDSTPRLAVLASARTGWWSNHQENAGLKWMQHVQLTPTSDDLSAVCSAIASTTAPTAVERRGLRYVLDRTGSNRPVLVRLIATIVENHTVGEVTTDTLISEDLSDYLRDRLLEDRLLPQSNPETVLLPATVDETVHATAVILATTPANFTQTVNAATTMLTNLGQRADSRWWAEHIVTMLSLMGWLTSDENTLVAVHDVVVDHVVESVIFLNGTVTHSGNLNLLLDASIANPRMLGNALVTLERIYDERAARDHINTSLRDSVELWLSERSTVILNMVASDPADGAATLSSLMTTPLLSGPEIPWVTLVKPFLSEVDLHPAVGEMLIVAARNLPDNFSREIVQPSLSWLSCNDTDTAERLLRHLLDREVFSPEEKAELVERAYFWTVNHLDYTGVDFLLTRLLKSPYLDDLQALDTVNRALAWLERHGTRAYASHLLTALLRRTDLDIKQAISAVRISEVWIKRNATHAACSYVVPAFLRRRELSPVQLGMAADLAIKMLVGNSGSESNYLLEALLSREDLEKKTTAAALTESFVWLDRYSGLEAIYLLQVLVGRTDLGERDTAAVLAAAHAWLDQHRGPEANYLLQALVARTDLGERDTAAVLAAAHAWLDQHRGPEANYLLRALVARTDLGKKDTAAVLAAAHAWLDQHRGPEANYLL